MDKKENAGMVPVGTPAEEIEEFKGAVETADKEVKEAIDAVGEVVKEAGDVTVSVTGAVKDDLAEFEHFVENGKMTILDKVYVIKDFLVKILPEHIRYALFHGLKPKQ